MQPVLSKEELRQQLFQWFVSQTSAYKAKSRVQRQMQLPIPMLGVHMCNRGQSQVLYPNDEDVRHLGLDLRLANQNGAAVQEIPGGERVRIQKDYEEKLRQQQIDGVLRHKKREEGETANADNHGIEEDPELDPFDQAADCMFCSGALHARGKRCEVFTPSSAWIRNWKLGYGVSMKGPNRRYKTSKKTRANNLKLWWLSVYCVRAFVEVVHGCDLDMENYDQSPYYTNESGSQNVTTLAIAGEKVPLLEGHSNTRSRWTIATKGQIPRRTAYCRDQGQLGQMD